MPRKLNLIPFCQFTAKLLRTIIWIISNSEIFKNRFVVFEWWWNDSVIGMNLAILPIKLLSQIRSLQIPKLMRAEGQVSIKVQHVTNLPGYGRYTI